MDRAALPKMSNAKELFLKELNQKYPFQEPEIQSCDEGETIDIIFGKKFVMSMTEEEHFSVTCGGEFNYFDTSEEVFHYLDDIFW